MLAHDIKVPTLSVADRAAPAICETAECSNVDMIVIATHGRSGLSNYAGVSITGSLADALSQAVHLPCLIAPAKRPVARHAFR
ncbi:MAG: universal stress protein [Chloroflexota bacterium]